MPVSRASPSLLPLLNKSAPQSEQIEKLYADAVEATHNISRANVQLDKAIRTNR